jgi:hypothetical protein
MSDSVGHRIMDGVIRRLKEEWALRHTAINDPPPKKSSAQLRNYSSFVGFAKERPAPR